MHSITDSDRLSLSRLMDTFLEAVCDPDGGDVLYGMHAPDANLCRADGLAPASAVDREDFARRHRDISVSGQHALPTFGDATLIEAATDPGAAETVAWFHVTETRARRLLTVALGLRSIDGTLRVGWCTLARGTEPWHYRDGLLQSLADYPWALKSKPAPSRVLLDASCFRRHWREPISFKTLPDARFTCRMSAACCKQDFEITVPREAQLIVDAMPWERLQPQLAGTRLPARPDGKLQLKSINETCRFLGARNQCLIHQALGRQPFGPCCVFPYSFAHTPEGVAVSLSPICGTARLGFGTPAQERAEDLHERLAHTEPRTAERYRLTPGVEISWESFRDIEKGLCECLAADDLPIRRRLYVGSRLLEALSANAPVETQRWLAEPAPEISSELRLAIRDMLARILKWDRTVLRGLPPLPATLHDIEVTDGPIVKRILENTLFCKVYSYPFDLTTAHNLLIVLYLLALNMQAAARGPLTDAMWQELGSLGVHGQLKDVLHEGVPEGFRKVFGTAQFGQWMLAV